MDYGLEDFVTRKSQNLDLLEYVRCDCPVCHKKNTFSITMTIFGVLYHCFHTNCDTKGIIKGNIKSRGRLIKDTLNKNTIPKIQEVLDMSNFDFNSINTVKSVLIKYNVYFVRDKACIAVDVKENRIVFFTWDRGGGKALSGIGRLLTGFPEYGVPKWKKYYTTEVYPIVFNCKSNYRGNPLYTKTCVITEDVFSALRVAKHHDAAAILGTSMTDFQIEYLHSLGFENIVISLDKDAQTSAIKLSETLSPYFKRVLTLPIDNDIKDMNGNEYSKYITSITKIRRKLHATGNN